MFEEFRKMNTSNAQFRYNVMIIYEIARTYILQITITALDGYEPTVFTSVKGVYDTLHTFNDSRWFAAFACR